MQKYDAEKLNLAALKWIIENKSNLLEKPTIKSMQKKIKESIHELEGISRTPSEEKTLSTLYQVQELIDEKVTRLYEELSKYKGDEDYSKKEEMFTQLLMIISFTVLGSKELKIIPKNPYLLAVYIEHIIAKDNSQTSYFLSIISKYSEDEEKNALLESLKLLDLPEVESIKYSEFDSIQEAISKSTANLDYEAVMKYKNDLSLEIVEKSDRFKEALSFLGYVKLEQSGIF